MAEFGEVMKQLVRMTNACKGRCDECPLDDSALCTGPWCAGNTEGIAEAERIVMQWAAEHPEPVYPTWEEWLTDMGVFEPLSSIPKMMLKNVGQVQLNGIPVYAMPTTKVFVPIPADIADKLGIQPKEG